MSTTASERERMEPCGTMALHPRLLGTNPDYATARARSEQHHWEVKRGTVSLARPGVTVIPIVVHVVWKTASQNISDDQVQSQILVLNRDFRKTNPDIGSIPAAFASSAADATLTGLAKAGTSNWSSVVLVRVIPLVGFPYGSSVASSNSIRACPHHRPFALREMC